MTFCMNSVRSSPIGNPKVLPKSHQVQGVSMAGAFSFLERTFRPLLPYWRGFERFINHRTVKTIGALFAFGTATTLAILALPSFQNIKASPAPPAAEKVAEEAKPAAPANPLPSVQMPPHSAAGPLPVPNLDSLARGASVTPADMQWIPLAYEGNFKVQGISFRYEIYVQLNNRPPVASLVIDGKKYTLREADFANVVGENGKSCIVKVKDVTRQSLYFNLHCYR